jgi:hypothetical protein
MKLNGVLLVLEDTVEVNAYTRRKFVLEHCVQGYSQYITFELQGKYTELLDNFKKGEKILVDFNIQGRRWMKDGEEKYFNTLQVYKIAIDESQEE